MFVKIHHTSKLVNLLITDFSHLRASSKNDKEALVVWCAAGANLSTPDYSGQTALQVVRTQAAVTIIHLYNRQSI